MFIEVTIQIRTGLEESHESRWMCQTEAQRIELRPTVDMRPNMRAPKKIPVICI
jgi:hypothetical protein